MSGNIHRFDPSTYDASEVHKPLAQIMREAEAERSRAGARMLGALWREITWLFRSRKALGADEVPAPQRTAQPAQPAEAVADKPRLAA